MIIVKISEIYDKKLFTVSSPMGTVSLFSLGIPMLFETVMNTLQGTVNTAVLSGYSEISVAAVGAVNTVINLVLLVGSIIAMGSSVVVSSAIGANDAKKAGETSFSAIFVSLIFALFLTPLFLFKDSSVLNFLNLSGEIYREGIIYFDIRIAFIVCNYMMSALLSQLKCYGYPKYTFFIGLLINTLNLVFNVFVIKCPDISPVTGVRGVAYSCALSNIIGLIVTGFIFHKVKIKIKKPDSIKDFFHHTAGVLKIGLPSGLSGAMFSLSMMVTTSFVALIGDYALSAKVYFTSILSYVYLFSMSIGSANSLLVGRRFGAGEFELAEKMNKQLSKITRAVNLTLSLIVIVLYKPLMGIFTENTQIISMALSIFIVDIITEQARAVSQVYEYALRAVGDVFVPMIILICSCWIFSIGLAYFLSIRCGLGLIGLWIGLAIDESVRAIVTYVRWKKGKWKYNRIS